jgi:multidrug efflux system membrane fusion protein
VKRLLLLVIVLAGLAAAAKYLDQRGWISLPAPFGSGASPSDGAGQAAGRGGRRGRRAPETGPIPVLIAKARHDDVPVTVDAVGTAQALNTVVVRSQVDGKLMAIAFEEGQDVRKGDVLARIDPTLHQATYDQAVAKKAQDEAQLANARHDLERYTTLAKGDYGSKQQADTQRATVAQLVAQVALDQAAIDSAKATLDYATVRAPIDGRTGIRLVDEGNIVHASDATGIVTITQLKPIALVFNLPQQQLRAVTAALARGEVPIEARGGDGRTVLDKGTIQVIDNQVDQTTGTVKVKAIFPNADLQLWPGQFANVRVTTDTLKGAVVVPTAAVQRGPNGAFVYVVGAGAKVKMTPVTAGLQNEVLTVIESGLAPPADVVTTGFSRLSDGTVVGVSAPGAADAAPPPAPPAERNRRRARDDGQPAAAPGTDPPPSGIRP